MAIELTYAGLVVVCWSLLAVAGFLVMEVCDEFR